MPAETPYVARGMYLTLFYFVFLMFSLVAVNLYEEFALIFHRYEGVFSFTTRPPYKKPTANPKYVRFITIFKREVRKFMDILMGRF